MGAEIGRKAQISIAVFLLIAAAAVGIAINETNSSDSADNLLYEGIPTNIVVNETLENQTTKEELNESSPNPPADAPNKTVKELPPAEDQSTSPIERLNVTINETNESLITSVLDSRNTTQYPTIDYLSDTLLSETLENGSVFYYNISEYNQTPPNSTEEPSLPPPVTPRRNTTTIKAGKIGRISNAHGDIDIQVLGINSRDHRAIVKIDGENIALNTDEKYSFRGVNFTIQTRLAFFRRIPLPEMIVEVEE